VRSSAIGLTAQTGFPCADACKRKTHDLQTYHSRMDTVGLQSCLTCYTHAWSVPNAPVVIFQHNEGHEGAEWAFSEGTALRTAFAPSKPSDNVCDTPTSERIRSVERPGGTPIPMVPGSHKAGPVSIDGGKVVRRCFVGSAMHTLLRPDFPCHVASHCIASQPPKDMGSLYTEMRKCSAWHNTLCATAGAQERPQDCTHLHTHIP
jgi:hypothetical protein